MSKQVWLGVDLGKDNFEAALATVTCEPKRWTQLPSRRFENTKEGIEALCCWVKAEMGPHRLAGICVESTGPLAWRFVEGLASRLGPVSLVNPRFISDYAKSLGLRDKTDRIDACVMALYGQATRPASRPLPSTTQRRLQQLTTLYEAAQENLRAWRNRLDEAVLSGELREMTEAMTQQLTELITKLESQIDALIEADEQLREDARRLQTIPGVGTKTARVVLAQFGDLRQYKRSELVALAGLYPRQFQSGTSVWRKPRIPKSGNARIRKALYFPAITAKKWCPPLRAFALRLHQRGLAPKAVVIAVMRKLLILMRALLVTEKDFQHA